MTHFSFEEELARYHHKCHHVKYSFLSDCNEILFFSTDFRKFLKYKTLLKSVQWEPICPIWTDRRDEVHSRVSQFFERA
jgi:hypothetical protein